MPETTSRPERRLQLGPLTPRRTRNASLDSLLFPANPHVVSRRRGGEGVEGGTGGGDHESRSGSGLLHILWCVHASRPAVGSFLTGVLGFAGMFSLLFAGSSFQLVYVSRLLLLCSATRIMTPLQCRKRGLRQRSNAAMLLITSGMYAASALYLAMDMHSYLSALAYPGRIFTIGDLVSVHQATVLTVSIGWNVRHSAHTYYGSEGSPGLRSSCSAILSFFGEHARSGRRRSLLNGCLLGSGSLRLVSEPDSLVFSVSLMNY